MLVSPFEWDQFGASAAFAAIFASNIYFLTKQGYFDTDMTAKPLLHTWSLSIEEQFYLVAPVLLIGLFYLARRSKFAAWKILVPAALLIFAASLAGCILETSESGRNFAFYLPQWRAWEFVAGGAIGFASTARLRRLPRLAWEIVGFAGLAAVVAGICLGADGGFYPGYAATLPVLGTVVLIAVGLASPQTSAARLLSLPPMTGIGLVSYGWYLWHWPLLTFARIADFGRLALPRDLAVVLIAFGLSVATYFLIERRAVAWRRQHPSVLRTPKVFAAAVAACIAAAVFVGGPSAAIYEHVLVDPIVVGTPTPAATVPAPCGVSGCGTLSGAGILIGDSHAGALSVAVIPQAARLGVRIVRDRQGGCTLLQFTDAEARTCTHPDAVLKRDVEALHAAPDFFVVFYRWNGRIRRGLTAMPPGRLQAMLKAGLARLSDGGRRRLLVIGPVPVFDYDITNCLFRARYYGLGADHCSIPRATVEAERAPTVALLHTLVDSLPQARLIDPVADFCDGRLCRPYAGPTALIKDTNHLSPFGAEWFYRRHVQDFLWAFAGNGPHLGKAALPAPASGQARQSAAQP